MVSTLGSCGPTTPCPGDTQSGCRLTKRSRAPLPRKPGDSLTKYIFNWSILNTKLNSESCLRWRRSCWWTWAPLAPSCRRCCRSWSQGTLHRGRWRHRYGSLKGGSAKWGQSWWWRCIKSWRRLLGNDFQKILFLEFYYCVYVWCLLGIL